MDQPIVTLDPGKEMVFLMSQHIGAPALPAVKAGEHVERGSVIGSPAAGLSVAIHASMSGIVREANDQFVMIDAE